jgi:hypothetical protein
MVNRQKNQQLLTMYKNNSPYICDFKASAHYKLFLTTQESATQSAAILTQKPCVYTGRPLRYIKNGIK